jgi:hypothetical protein
MLAWTAPLSAQADGENDGFVQTVNGYQVTLMFAEHPAVGENQVHILIQNAMDMPVSHATVQVALVAVEENHHEAAQEATSHESMAGMDMGAASSSHDGMAGMDMDEAEAAHDEIQAVHLKAAHEDGEYSGKVHIETTGEWVISVHLIIQGEEMEVDFPLTVKAGSNMGILTGFAGVNILILIVAAALKSKSTAI